MNNRTRVLAALTWSFWALMASTWGSLYCGSLPGSFRSCWCSFYIENISQAQRCATKIHTTTLHWPTSGGKTQPQTFLHRSLGFLACREVMSTSVAQGEPNGRAGGCKPEQQNAADDSRCDRLPIWLKESDPAGMMRGFVRSVETVFLFKKSEKDSCQAMNTHKKSKSVCTRIFFIHLSIWLIM